MKRFFSLLLAALFILCLCSACASDPTDDTAAGADTSAPDLPSQRDLSLEETPDDAAAAPALETDWTAIYDPILSQYRAAIENGFYLDILRSGDGDWSVIGENINVELLIASGNFESYFVFYALQDIDGNGIPELLIGGSDSADTVTNYDVFTYDGTNIVPLFPDLQFGYRVTFRLLSNGIFAVTWNSSAAHSGYSFYRIAEDGITAEEVESICLKADPESSPNTLRCYHDAEGIAEIPEAEYNAILEGYRNISSMELSWTALSAP